MVVSPSVVSNASDNAWQTSFEDWLKPFLAALKDSRRAHWAPIYLQGLLAAGERKSIQPLAGRVAPEQYGQLHHFVCGATWDPAPLEKVLALEADRLLGGDKAYLIIDDTALLKKGNKSVGVAHQYAGEVGKLANCQALVSLTLSREEVPIAIALRLFLPEPWTKESARMEQAGVPESRQRAMSKSEIALEELDRVRTAGVRFGVVLADAGYGSGAEFRQALSRRNLSWAVGVSRVQRAYPQEVQVIETEGPRSGARGGRPRRHGQVSHPSRSVEAFLSEASWHSLTWRHGTKGPLKAEFAALRVRVADGAKGRGGQALPGEAVWLVGERRRNGEVKYYLSNLPAMTSLAELAATIKARWSCEQAHQQLKEEIGLDHFEGRGWLGLHRHALLCMMSLAFLQHLRLREAERLRVEGPSVQEKKIRSASADTADDSPSDSQTDERSPDGVSSLRLLG